MITLKRFSFHILIAKDYEDIPIQSKTDVGLIICGFNGVYLQKFVKKFLQKNNKVVEEEICIIEIRLGRVRLMLEW